MRRSCFGRQDRHGDLGKGPQEEECGVLNRLARSRLDGSDIGLKLRRVLFGEPRFLACPDLICLEIHEH